MVSDKQISVGRQKWSRDSRRGGAIFINTAFSSVYACAYILFRVEGLLNCSLNSQTKQQRNLSMKCTDLYTSTSKVSLSARQPTLEVNFHPIYGGGGSSLRAVWLNRGSLADRAGPERCAQRTQRLGGVWGIPPRKFWNLRRSEIDSDAFWDAFPAWQGTHTN